MERLLDAAERIIVRDGVGALSTHHIATEAGVPIGTVYQFFEDKQAVIDALARGYIEGSQSVMAGFREVEAEPHWSDLVEVLIDAFVDRYRATPAYRLLWLGQHLGPELQRENEASNAAMAQMLARIIVTTEGLAPDACADPELLRSCRVGIHVGEAVLRLAFAADPDGDPDIIAEAKHLERVYLDDVVKRAGGRR